MRTIILGAGLMGRHHAQAAEKAGASIVAVVDPNRQAAEALAARHRGAVSHDDAAQALATVEADVVHICTPESTHEALAEAAAKAGLHALIEKPMAANAAATRQILAAFSQASRVACPAHQYAFQRSIRTAAEALPRLGSVRQIAFDICSAGGDSGKLDLDRLTADILPHPLSMIQKLVPGTQLAELAWSCLRTAPGEWLISAPIGTASLTITLSMSGRPTRFQTRIIAERGSIDLDNFHDFSVEQSGDVSRTRKITQPFVRGASGLASASRNLVGRAARRELAYPGLRTLVAEFYAAARGAGPAPINSEEAIAVAEARDRLIALAANG